MTSITADCDECLTGKLEVCIDEFDDDDILEEFIGRLRNGTYKNWDLDQVQHLIVARKETSLETILKREHFLKYTSAQIEAALPE